MKVGLRNTGPTPPESYIGVRWDNVWVSTEGPGQVVTAEDFDPWGVVNMSYVSGNPDQRFKYTGKERDTESGYDYFGARYYDARIARFLATDPLAASTLLLRWSPYHYSFCNPLIFIDPTGMAPEVRITGPDADQAVDETNRANKNVTISRDASSGKLSATGEAITPAEKKLVEAINDPMTVVNLKTTRESQVVSIDGTAQPINGGLYDGSEISADGNTSTSQFINLRHARAVESVGGPTAGESVIHEINESYIGAKLNPGKPYTTSRYDEAHFAASMLDAPSGAIRFEPVRISSTMQSMDVVGPKGRKTLYYLTTE